MKAVRCEQDPDPYVDPLTGLANVDVVLVGGMANHEYIPFPDDVESSPVDGLQHGEIWLGHGDYEYSGGQRMRKPQPRGSRRLARR